MRIKDKEKFTNRVIVPMQFIVLLSIMIFIAYLVGSGKATILY